MKLAETAPLASDLEQGLGEVHWLLGRINREARLGMEVCGIVSVAISERLTEQGIDNHLVLSQPNLTADPAREHVFVVLDDEDSGTVIDATYAQFYNYAGLTPGYVSMGGRSRFFPHDKIAQFPVGEHEKLVQQMSLQARYFMDHYQPVDELAFQKIPFEELDEEGIAKEYTKIWAPDNLGEFTPSEATREAGKKLATFILPEHVKLVA